MHSINAIIQEALAQDASDIHLIAGEYPTLRVHGRLLPLESAGQSTPEDTESIVRQIAPERSQLELEEWSTADFGVSYQEKCRFRVAIYKQRNTVAISMRILPFRLMTFDEIGIPDSIKPVLHSPKGLFLATGPTGCGKTTTLATLIDYINENRDCHVVTIEDPIEFYHTAKRSIFTQREVRVDVPSFAEGTVRAMRMDPDVMLVGEMRDLATIRAAITAAETGHLVFSTLHTTGAARTVERIVGVFPVDEQEQIRIQLSGVLICVISQILLPRWNQPGRIAAMEIMVGTIAVQHMIRDKKEHAIFSAIQTGHHFGMQTLDYSLLSLCQKELVDPRDVMRYAGDRTEVVQKLQEMGHTTGEEAILETGSRAGSTPPK
jgi:twitching motility protein PilT